MAEEFTMDTEKKCRYCDHAEDRHEEAVSWSPFRARPCNARNADGTHCTCYGYNLDLPNGRARALSAAPKIVLHDDNPSETTEDALARLVQRQTDLIERLTGKPQVIPCRKFFEVKTPCGKPPIMREVIDDAWTGYGSNVMNCERCARVLVMTYLERIGIAKSEKTR